MKTKIKQQHSDKMQQRSTILCYFFYHLFPLNHILEETCPFISSNNDEITVDVILNSYMEMTLYIFSWFMFSVRFQSDFKFSNDSFEVKKKRKSTLFYVGESVS